MYGPTLRELDEAAAPRPWRAYFTAHGDPHVIGSAVACRRADGEPVFPQDLRATVSTAAADYGRADAELIAAARNALPSLLRLAESWRTLLAEVGVDALCAGSPAASDCCGCPAHTADRALRELGGLVPPVPGPRGPTAPVAAAPEDATRPGQDGTGACYAVRRPDGWHVAVWDGEAFAVTSDWQSGDRWLPGQVLDSVLLSHADVP